jgi:branched-chain amino acid transport system ATP-binding protein
MSERELILKTQNLGIAFGGLKAVNDFNLEIYQGELVGLIGPNGSGKTTVFNMLTGVYVPTEGEIFLRGKRITGMKTHRIVAQGVARTFQNIRLFSEMSVIDNVKIAFTKDIRYNLFDTMFRTPKYFQSEQEVTDKAMECLRIVRLADKAAYRANSLPYGQQRKLEIARALATDMKLLLLDEPAAGMNPTETSELLECINDIRKKFQIAILLIEHDMSLVMRICERIQVINFGNTIAHGYPNEIAHNPDVIEAYLGEEAVENA